MTEAPVYRTQTCGTAIQMGSARTQNGTDAIDETGGRFGLLGSGRFSAGRGRAQEAGKQGRHCLSRRAAGEFGDRPAHWLGKGSPATPDPDDLARLPMTESPVYRTQTCGTAIQMGSARTQNGTDAIDETGGRSGLLGSGRFSAGRGRAQVAGIQGRRCLSRRAAGEFGDRPANWRGKGSPATPDPDDLARLPMTETPAFRTQTTRRRSQSAALEQQTRAASYRSRAVRPQQTLRLRFRLRMTEILQRRIKMQPLVLP